MWFELTKSLQDNLEEEKAKVLMQEAYESAGVAIEYKLHTAADNKDQQLELLQNRTCDDFDQVFIQSFRSDYEKRFEIACRTTSPYASCETFDNSDTHTEHMLLDLEINKLADVTDAQQEYILLDFIGEI